MAGGSSVAWSPGRSAGKVRPRLFVTHVGGDHAHGPLPRFSYRLRLRADFPHLRSVRVICGTSGPLDPARLRSAVWDLQDVTGGVNRRLMDGLGNTIHQENIMRHLFGLLIAGGLLLGPAIAAKAQTNTLNSFGTYPAGIMTGSPYGGNWSGYYGLNSGGYPLNTYSQPYNASGANYLYMTPGTNYRYPYAPGTTTYGSAYAAPGSSPYGNAPGYNMTYPSYPYGTPSYGYYNPSGRGRGMFGG